MNEAMKEAYVDTCTGVCFDWSAQAADLNGSPGGGWHSAAHRAHRVESSRSKVDNLARGPHQSSGNTINKSDSVGGGIPDIGNIHL